MNGIVLPETRQSLVAVVERLKAVEGIEGLILGGTELSLIFPEGTDVSVPLLDTTKLHAEEMVAQLLSI